MKAAARFRIVNDQVAGVWARFAQVTCHQCSFPAKVKLATASSLDAEGLSRKFRAKGWKIGPRDLCPRCQSGKAPMSPASRRAAFCRIANVPRAQPIPASPPASKETPAVVTPVADAPRTPTIEDRRRVRDAVDTHYLEAEGCWSQSWSDRALAAKLNVPAKWVTDIREALGFGPDVNEAAKLQAGEYADLQKSMAELQDNFLRRFDELERRLKKLGVDRAYAPAATNG